MAILVTGGAGYIGSHMTFALCDQGEKVVILDNLSTGVPALLDARAQFVRGDVGDKTLLRNLLDKYEIESVIHFAGSIVVPDSVERPLEYYANNTTASHSLIQACVLSGVKHFIFSSTAAVYGMPRETTVAEDTPLMPINPYGRSKLMTEWILEDAARAHDFRYAALRYFNVAGAEPRGRTGQSTPRATHLIKRACQVALGRESHLDIFGTEYPTPDGTGVRDYIHVSDLVTAHELALKSLQSGAASSTYNCGYGHGYSVREIISAVERVAGRKIPIREVARRPGDPPMLIANASRIRETLKWRPEYDDLGLIVSSAFAWESGLA